MLDQVVMALLTFLELNHTGGNDTNDYAVDKLNFARAGNQTLEVDCQF